MLNLQSANATTSDSHWRASQFDMDVNDAGTLHFASAVVHSMGGIVSTAAEKADNPDDDLDGFILAELHNGVAQSV